MLEEIKAIYLQLNKDPPEDPVIIKMAIEVAKKLINSYNNGTTSLAAFQMQAVKIILDRFAKGGPYIKNIELRRESGLLAKSIDIIEYEEEALDYISTIFTNEK